MKNGDKVRYIGDHEVNSIDWGNGHSNALPKGTITEITLVEDDDIVWVLGTDEAHYWVYKNEVELVD
jgi:hypothetical protein